MITTTNIKTPKMPEYIIYAFLWVLFLIIPVITNNYGDKGDFLKICYDWMRMLPFIFVFLINNFWLLPEFLFKGNTKFYVAFLLLVAICISSIFQVIGPEIYKNDPKLLEQRILQDPQFGRDEMKPGAPAVNQDNTIVSPELFRPSATTNLQTKRLPSPKKPIFQLFNTLFISLLIAGFNTAISVTNRWFLEEEARKEIEKEHMKSELAFLQNQISPHFFMNTLNNIHALIEADQKMAQNAVLKLSDMMRYLLYESGKGTTTLKKEIDFLKSYVKLMQLRVDDSVRVDFDTPEKFNNVNLPPLLFISFIENAFKHGVSYRESSAIFFRLSQNIDSIEFVAVNTISSFGNSDPLRQHGGIGLENIKKRLDLLYGENYVLRIDKNEHEYRVTLKIPS